MRRRTYLEGCGALGSALLAGCSGLSPFGGGDGQASEPHMYQVDAGNTGYLGSVDGPTEEVDPEWTASDPRFVEATPAVVDDTVYVGSRDGAVYALDAADGTTEWRYASLERPLSWVDVRAPAVVDGTVYASSSTYRAGRVFAVDAAAGTEQWTTATEDEVGTPTVADGTVFVFCERSERSELVAYDADDGSELWTVGGHNQPASAVAVADGAAYVLTPVEERTHALDLEDAARVTAVSTSDGSERWTAEVATYGHPGHPLGVAAADGTVYLGTKDVVYALDADDGSEQWSVREPAVAFETPVLTDDAVIVAGSEVHRVPDKGSSFERSVLVALETDDGTERWRAEWDRAVVGPPTAAGDAVCLGVSAAPYSAVKAFDPADGTELWTRQGPFALGQAPALTEDGLVVGSNAGSDTRAVYRLSPSGDPLESGATTTAGDLPASGHPVDRYDAGRTGHSPVESGPDGPVTERWRTWADSSLDAPLVHDGTMYSSGVGSLQARAVDDGSLRWEFGYGPDTTPVTDGETVFLTNGFGRLRAVDVDDGLERWYTRVDDGEWTRRLLLFDGTLYAVVDSDDAELVVALDPATGEERSRWTWPYDSRTDVAMDDHGLYAGTKDRVVSLAPDDGAERWAHDVGSRPSPKPVVRDATVYAVGSSAIHAFDADSGTRRWRVETHLRKAEGLGELIPIAATGDALYAGDDGLRALATEDGTERWAAPDLDLTTAPITVVDGLVYCFVEHDDGDEDTALLQTVDAATGDPGWSVGPFEHVQSVVVAAGRLFVHTSDDLHVFGDERD